MAEEETEGTEEGEEQPKSGKGKLIIIGVVLLVLGVGGFFGYPYVMNMISPPEPVAGEVVEEEPTDKPALFASLHPPLVVNFTDDYGEPHFMQITLEAMAREQSIVDAVRDHAAVIRNSLILMYSNVDYNSVSTREGKEQMLADALEEIQSIIESETGETGVEAVYFTGLIIQ